MKLLFLRSKNSQILASSEVQTSTKLTKRCSDFKKMYNVGVASFIWGKMKTTAQETASQRAQRWGEVCICLLLVEGLCAVEHVSVEGCC